MLQEITQQGKLPLQTQRRAMTTHTAIVEDDQGLSIRAAAKEAGLSEATLRRAIDEGIVDVYRNGRTVMISHKTVIELRAGKVTRKAPSLAAREIARMRGEVAKEVFLRFERGSRLIDVVTELSVDPMEVNRLWDQWSILKEKDLRSERPQCIKRGDGCSDELVPLASVCTHHASRLRELSDDELAMLTEYRRKKARCPT